MFQKIGKNFDPLKPLNQKIQPFYVREFFKKNEFC